MWSQGRTGRIRDEINCGRELWEMVPGAESHLPPEHLSPLAFYIRLISRTLTQFLAVVRCPDEG
jgi:hypothetical protein